MTTETPDPPPEGVTLSGHFVVSASEIAELAELRAQVAQYKEDAERYLAAIEWALGTRGEFPEPWRAGARYWWREELRHRAGLRWDGVAWVSPAIDKARGK